MLKSLARRPRSREILERGLAWGPFSEIISRRIDRECRAAETGGREARLGLATLRFAEAPRRHSSVTDALAARLSDESRERILSALEPAQQEFWDRHAETDQRVLLLAYAAHFEIEPAMAELGMSFHKPPESVHAMARGDLSAAGAPTLADLVVGELERSGLELRPGQRILDFGCSSGRVLRSLIAVYPEIDWLGCDPNDAAVAWAAENLDGEFFVSGQTPPLPLEDATLDGAFAISIWSHFSPAAARLWLDEMHRVIKPGGRLLLTTHGWHSLRLYKQAFEAGNGGLSPEHVLDCQRALLERGSWYFDSFGENGDWGVKSPDWGHSFFLPEWLLDELLPQWSLRSFVEAGLEANQDVYVFERR
jgi:SAM-dependent methyltransferase